MDNSLSTKIGAKYVSNKIRAEKISGSPYGGKSQDCSSAFKS